MTPDEQEARSLAYAFGVRVLQLSSGNWAHFNCTTLVAILPHIDTAQVQLIQQDQERAYAEEAARMRARPTKPRVSGDALLKELGL